jgi:hypothetical protein
VILSHRAIPSRKTSEGIQCAPRQPALGEAAVRRTLWIAYGILIVGGAWFALMVSGVLGSWALHASKVIPAWLLLAGILAIPPLMALCTLDLLTNLRVRIVALALLLAFVPTLPLAFDAHPILVTLVGFGIAIEAYSIPVINRRLSLQGKGGG